MRHLEDFLICCVFISKAQFVKNVWMFVKYVEWKFTLYTFLKMHLIFCLINLNKSFLKSKWCQILWDTLYVATFWKMLLLTTLQLQKQIALNETTQTNRTSHPTPHLGPLRKKMHEVCILTLYVKIKNKQNPKTLNVCFCFMINLSLLC